MATATLSPAEKAWATRRERENAPPKPKPILPKRNRIQLPKEVKLASSKDMMLRTCVLSLTFSKFGNRRKIDNELFEVTPEEKQKEQVDKNWINATKKLLEAEEMDEINSLYSDLYGYVQSRALPSYIKRGVHLLPKAFDTEVDARLKEGQEKLRPLVEKIIQKLTEYKRDAKERLRHLYDEDDYPTSAELRESFSIHWRFLYVDSADGISKELVEEERKKAERDWTSLRENIKNLLRGQLKGFVDHLTERLTPEKDGRPKQFKQGSIDKLQEFLNTFDVRNIVNDQQLKALVDQAKSLVKYDAEVIRTDSSVREYVLEGFENIQSLLDPLVVKQPLRRIRLQ